MATFTIISGGVGNQAPTVKDYSLAIENRENVTLQVGIFDSIFSDPENDSLTKIKVTGAPLTQGVFLFNGSELTVGQEITYADIQAGNLTVVGPNQDALFVDSFLYQGHDGNQFSENIARFTILAKRLVQEINNAPSVGNNTINLNYGQTYLFTVDDFTINTTPAYYDAEGDALATIKITSLPSSGSLKLNGSAVTVGQVINALDIPNLTYKGDNSLYSSYTSNFKFQASDLGSGNYSNDGTFNMQIAELVANAPTVDDNSASLTQPTYQFNTDDFINNFNDSDGDSYRYVKLESLPTIGTLKLLGNNAVKGNTFEVSNSSVLKFVLPLNYTIENGILYKYDKAVDQIVIDYDNNGYKLDSHQDGMMSFSNEAGDTVIVQGDQINTPIDFTFKTSDNSPVNLYSNVSTFTLTPSGDVNTQPPYVNLPPTTGDNTLNTDYDKTITFKQEDFVDDTDPRFSDPEGDEPYELKILSLPEYGVLQLRGVDVTVNQILSFETDIRTGDFTYTPDNTRTDIPSVKFRRAISDSGSKIFVE